jgi:hypothetical protein
VQPFPPQHAFKLVLSTVDEHNIHSLPLPPKPALILIAQHTQPASAFKPALILMSTAYTAYLCLQASPVLEELNTHRQLTFTFRLVLEEQDMVWNMMSTTYTHRQPTSALRLVRNLMSSVRKMEQDSCSAAGTVLLVLLRSSEAHRCWRTADRNSSLLRKMGPVFSRSSLSSSSARILPLYTNQRV